MLVIHVGCGKCICIGLYSHSQDTSAIVSGWLVGLAGLSQEIQGHFYIAILYLVSAASWLLLFGCNG